MLRSWLQKNEITAVSTGHNTGLDSKSGTKRKKRHKKPKDLEGFLVSSGDEESEMHELPGSEDEDDELAGGVTISHRRTMVRSVDGLHSSKQGVTNAVLLSGPPGCGKTAAVYAAAKELGFEIFEVNPGSRRSGRDLLERVGDMTQNHLVHLLKTLDNGPAAGARTEPAASKPEPAPSGQNTMNSFFKQKSRAPTSKKASSGAEKEVKPASGKKQSLILLEEVDVLFEEDKSFWSGVIALMSQSKRPIVLTCNDESRLPLDDLSLHAIFRFRPPPLDLAVDYMLLLAANEGHALDRQPITDLYIVLQRDLRKTIAQLDFWCQMAVGSRRCGVDWLVNRPPPPGPGDPASFPRTVSSGTYMQGMGWFSSDIFVLEHDHYEKRSQLMMDCLDQWHIGLMDWHENKQGQTYPDMFSRLDALAQEEDIADVRSALDVLCRESWSTPNTVGCPPFQHQYVLLILRRTFWTLRHRR
jgi:sorting nexin-8